MIPRIGTAKSTQTMMTQIRLHPNEQSDQGILAGLSYMYCQISKAEVSSVPTSMAILVSGIFYIIFYDEAI